MVKHVLVSSKQFKIMGINFGKEVTDRKELLATTKEKMTEQVSSDKKVRYEELKHVLMQVLARAITNSKSSGRPPSCTWLKTRRWVVKNDEQFQPLPHVPLEQGTCRRSFSD
jgi:hypothetical protein